MENLKVLTGSSEWNSNGNLASIKRIVQHKKFGCLPHDYDYSLIELDEPLQFDNTRQPIELPYACEIIPHDQFCFVSGFGMTHYPDDGDELQSELRGTVLRAIEQEKCLDFYHRYLTDRMICAGLDEDGRGSGNV